MGQALRERGVEEAAAQYWLSYRLSFLWHEQPVVVPLNPREDRYSPHRARFYAARTVAFVFHPSEPRAVPQQVLPALKASGGRVEVLRVAGFTVLVWQKP